MRLFILVLVLLIIFYFRPSVEGYINYKKCSTVDIPHVIKDIYKDREFTQNNKDYDLYFPCGYNYIENELNGLDNTKSSQKIFGITGCDSIVAKDTLWKLLKKYFGNNANKYSPKTYLVHDKDDINLFKNEFALDKKYILKKNIQRQEGIYISNNKNDILKKINDDRTYVVIQELLTNPFLLNERKINLRVYLLVICNKGNVKVYYHKNGFLYYTRNKIKNTSYTVLSTYPVVITLS